MLAEKQRLLTIPEVAALLQVSRTTIYKLMGSGGLRSVRVGKVVRFLQEDVDAYLRLLKASQ